MAKVQIVAVISGTRNGNEWPAPGELLEVGEDEAAQLIASRLARVPEKAPRPEPEKAVARKPETRKGLTTKDV